MSAIIASVLVFIVLGWFLRRLFPALFSAALVLLAPLWLVAGLFVDLYRGLRSLVFPGQHRKK